MTKPPDSTSSSKKRYSVIQSIEWALAGAYDVYDNKLKRVYLPCMTRSEARKLRAVLNRQDEVKAGCRCPMSQGRDYERLSQFDRVITYCGHCGCKIIKEAT